MIKNTSSTKPLKKILGIDTATPETVIAVNDALKTWQSDRNQTNELLPAIDKLLTKLALKPIQLDGVVVNLGPGSFTGLRVGVTVANGFGYGLGLPVAGMDQFSLIEKLCPKSDVVLIAAGRDEVFFKARSAEPKMIKVANLSKSIKSGDIVCVDDYRLIPEIHEQLSSAGTIELINLTRQERMEAMLRFAKLPKRFSQVLPVYVRGANITKPKPKR